MMPILRKYKTSKEVQGDCKTMESKKAFTRESQRPCAKTQETLRVLQPGKENHANNATGHIHALSKIL